MHCLKTNVDIKQAYPSIASKAKKTIHDLAQEEFKVQGWVDLYATHTQTQRTDTYARWIKTQPPRLLSHAGTDRFITYLTPGHIDA